jgi:hypothetical protein
MSSERFTYPRAGKESPPEVKKAIAKFHQLPEFVKETTPMLDFLLGGSTQPYKMAPKDAEYVSKQSGKQNCANCKYSYGHCQSGKYVCSMIAGNIAPAGWCRLWES